PERVSVPEPDLVREPMAPEALAMTPLIWLAPLLLSVRLPPKLRLVSTRSPLIVNFQGLDKVLRLT
ncbi:MAG: hypothetical protein EB047_07025, partial [Chitinophagaceae bacterium]|nr:hypothetical protein [Chitinophagaceae bacterium]